MNGRIIIAPAPLAMLRLAVVLATVTTAQASRVSVREDDSAFTLSNRIVTARILMPA
jgi:hypothetical protein